MVNKSTIIELTKSVLLSAILVGTVSAECVLQSTTVNTSVGSVESIDNIQRSIIPTDSGYTCSVRFKALIGNQWYTTTGEYDYTQTNHNSACATAVSAGKRNLLDRLSSETQSRQILTCHDDESQKTMQKINRGESGYLSQFRPHPKYPDYFNHHNARCRWFIDPAFNGVEVDTFEGIVCNLNSDQWTVVDKF